MMKFEGQGLGTHIVSEASDWLRLVEPRHDLATARSTHLLSLGEPLGGNFRFAIEDSRVFLVGEVRAPGVEFSREDTLARLHRFAEGSPCYVPMEDDLVESALAASRLPWSRRDATWVVPPSSERPQELRVDIEERGVRVEAVLATWDVIGDAAQQAIASFLCRSHSGLRFARTVMDATSVRVVSRVEEPDFLEMELLDSLASVAAACRLLARETRALACEDLANAYLETSCRRI